MGKHVATTADNDDAVYWFRATTGENHAWKAGRQTIKRVGRHARAEQCNAHVLVAGGMNVCVVPPAEHEGKKHSHPVYGTWEGDLWDLDAYRKRFVR